MFSFIFWYLTITFLGLATFPLAYWLLPALPGRGYALSRALGWLVWGFVFWLLGSLQVVGNNLGGQILALLLLLGLSAFAWSRIDRQQLSEWWHARRGLVLAIEILFLLAFAGMSLVRAANPDIFGTEKPMEMAFISSILRSPNFPPADPWLSGYAISYYYFGYVLVAMLARFTSTPGPVAFNLGIALVFALSAIGAYGILYDLFQRLIIRQEQKPHNLAFTVHHPLLASLFGPIFVLLISNLEGFLEVLYSLHLFWHNGSSAFWTWLGIADLNQPPVGPPSWLPRTFGTGNWWWWRASRVLQDFTLNGVPKGDIIDEFPVFSFILSDLHPHLLAMPFMFLVVGLALNVFLGGGEGLTRLFGFNLPFNRQTFALGAVVVGGMAFLNTWDILISLTLFVGAFLLWRAYQNGWSWDRLAEILGLTIGLGLAILVLYLPFFLSFSSQAGGPLPNLIYVTHGAYLWVMFGAFFVPIGAWLIVEWRTHGTQVDLRRGLFISLIILLSLVAIMLLLTLLVANIGLFSSLNEQATTAASIFLSSLGATSWSQALTAAFTRRILIPGTWLTLFLLLAGSSGFLQKIGTRRQVAAEVTTEDGHADFDPDQVKIPGDGDEGIGVSTEGFELDEETIPVENAQSPTIRSLQFATDSVPTVNYTLPPRPGSPTPPPSLESTLSSVSLTSPLSPLPYPLYFILFLIFLGGLLVLGPEFVFLRDQFGYRINTIFKFYFEAWLIWGLAAGFAAAALFMLPRRWWTALVDLLLIVVMGMGLTYTALGFWDKTDGFHPPAGLTLDGSAYLARSSPNVWAGIQWLQTAPYGNIVEAAPILPDRGEYSDFGQVAEFSGLPTVIGWSGHEIQWGRTYAITDPRQNDVQTIYTSRDWAQTQSLLAQYQIRYIFVGPKERSLYRLYEAKFQRNLDVAFKQGDVTIYEVP